MRVALCPADEIQDPGSKGFTVDAGNNNIEMFVVHKDGEYHGYINSCPHTGASLEWQEHQFLDMDNAFIQCSTHDALFEIANGLCVLGPCIGDQLTRVALTQINGELVVEIT